MKAFILRHKADIIFAFVLASFFLLFNTVAINAYIPSASMENTLMTHDRIIGYKLYKDYKRGDIAIFKYDPDTYYVKRVIGVGGDRIEIKDHKVYVNGEELDEPYVWEEMDTDQDLYYEVPEDSYFFLGDNRNNSVDSRSWNKPYRNKDKMVAKAGFRYWPLDRIGFVE